MASRRRFLQGAALATAGVVAAPQILAPRGGWAATGDGARPRRVIFLVSDGMSQGVVTLADQLSRQVRNKGTHWVAMLEDRQTAKGFFETHSLNSMVTDSAAASTAWGSGTRVANTAINTLPDGSKLTPILPLLKDQGIGTGLVTTAKVTHATPAGFASSVPHRDSESDISPQYLNVVDVVLGGGIEHFDKSLRKDGEDLLGRYAAENYTVALDRDALLGAKEDAKLLGLFSRSHVPYTVDHMNSPELLKSTPTLAEMTKKALAILEKNPNGFLLQVEGARIDHAAHANDIAGALWDQIAFDDAVEVALDFQKKHPDTLVILTSDHGNANPGLNGMGRGYTGSTECFRRIAAARASVPMIEAALGSIPADPLAPAGAATGEAASTGRTGPTSEATQKLIAELMGIDLSLEEAALVADSASGRHPHEINGQHRGFVGILGQVIGNHTGIGWTGTTHTEDMTLITAQGPGQDAWNGYLKNTEFFPIIAETFGVSHRNKAMTPEEAKKHLAAVPEARRLADWA